MTIISTSTNVILRIVLNYKNKNFAVYKDSEEVLKKVSFLEGSIEDDVKLMDHPLENGEVITDHEVFNPNKGFVNILIDDEDQSSLAELNQYYQNGTLLTIKAKGELFPNMIICAKPFRIEPDYFNKTVYNLSFRTVQLAETQYVKMSQNQVRDSKDASTVNSGQKSAVQL